MCRLTLLLKVKICQQKINFIGLEKEGWHITDDPYTIPVMRRHVYIDLAAEKIISAEKDAQKIAIEIKSFLSLSQISDLYNALGQFQIYKVALRNKEPDRVLYLAIPDNVYDWLMSDPFTIEVIEEYQLRIIVFKSEEQIITQWIS